MPGQNYDILVIDDQAGVRWLICEALIDEGYSIDQAASGSEALARLGRNDYRLILLDVKMPGMNGFEILEKIKKFDSDVPVVMMTAYGELDIEQEVADGARPVNYISKPFDLDDLRNIVRRYLSNQNDVDFTAST